MRNQFMKKILIVATLCSVSFFTSASETKETCESSTNTNAVKIFYCGKGLKVNSTILMEKLIRVSDGQIIANVVIAEFSSTTECQTEALNGNLKNNYF
jgi:hypothetical protein